VAKLGSIARKTPRLAGMSGAARASNHVLDDPAAAASNWVRSSADSAVAAARKRLTQGFCVEVGDWLRSRGKHPECDPDRPARRPIADRLIGSGVSGGLASIAPLCMIDTPSLRGRADRSADWVRSRGNRLASTERRSRLGLPSYDRGQPGRTTGQPEIGFDRRPRFAGQRVESLFWTELATFGVIGFDRAETTGFPTTIIPPPSGSPAVSARSGDPGGLGSFAPISAVGSPRPASFEVGRLARTPLLVPSNWKRSGGDAQTPPP
jgi:hypothetical protein